MVPVTLALLLVTLRVDELCRLPDTLKLTLETVSAPVLLSCVPADTLTPPSDPVAPCSAATPVTERVPLTERVPVVAVSVVPLEELKPPAPVTVRPLLPVTLTELPACSVPELLKLGATTVRLLVLLTMALSAIEIDPIVACNEVEELELDEIVLLPDSVTAPFPCTSIPMPAWRRRRLTEASHRRTGGRLDQNRRVIAGIHSPHDARLHSAQHDAIVAILDARASSSVSEQRSPSSTMPSPQC